MWHNLAVGLCPILLSAWMSNVPRVSCTCFAMTIVILLHWYLVWAAKQQPLMFLIVSTLPSKHEAQNLPKDSLSIFCLCNFASIWSFVVYWPQALTRHPNYGGVSA